MNIYQLNKEEEKEVNIIYADLDNDGIALEIENKSITKDKEEVIRTWVSKIGLDMNDSYRLS